MAPFKVAPPIKCVKCDKAVYPNDKQINYDGLIFHSPCSKCADCGCNVTVSNFAIADEGTGKKELLCKVHYKARFNAAGGVYAGAGKFAKQSERELVSADRDRRSSTETMSPVKAGTGLEKDSNYKLDRPVTTPDKRPSVSIPAVETTAAEVEKAPEIVNRRASLKSTGNTKVAEEIAEENSRSASTPSRTVEDATVAPAVETVFTAVEESAAPAPEPVAEATADEPAAASGCPKCDCGSNCTACGTDACACADFSACRQACAADGSCCNEGGETATCAKCDCDNNCTDCGTDACRCGDDCACKK